jgi:hypothetical protein
MTVSAIATKRADDRRRALARIAHHLKVAHDSIALARSENDHFALGLDLPDTRPLIDATHAAAKKLQGERED